MWHLDVRLAARHWLPAVLTMLAALLLAMPAHSAPLAQAGGTLVGKQGTVSSDLLNVRSAPALTGKVIGQLRAQAPASPSVTPSPIGCRSTFLVDLGAEVGSAHSLSRSTAQAALQPPHLLLPVATPGPPARLQLHRWWISVPPLLAGTGRATPRTWAVRTGISTSRCTRNLPRIHT